MDIKNGFVNEVALWKNDNRQSERHPHLKGQATINGVQYWASAWKSDGTNPKAPIVKIKLNAKDAVHNAGMQGVRKALETKSKPAVAKPAEEAPSIIDFEDDIPF